MLTHRSISREMGGWIQMMRLKGVLGAFAFVLSTFALQGSAFAGPQWCEEDPEFVVNGALVDVTTWFPGSYASVTSEVHFDMQVPSNVFAAVVSLPGTVPVTASISRTLPPYYGIGRIPVVVTVTTTSSATFQHVTTITGLGGTLVSSLYGWSTTPLKAKFSMYGL
jgi:hypothetical protein